MKPELASRARTLAEDEWVNAQSIAHLKIVQQLSSTGQQGQHLSRRRQMFRRLNI
jgi:hypothetical protein